MLSNVLSEHIKDNSTQTHINIIKITVYYNQVTINVTKAATQLISVVLKHVECWPVVLYIPFQFIEQSVNILKLNSVLDLIFYQTHSSL